MQELVGRDDLACSSAPATQRICGPLLPAERLPSCQSVSLHLMQAEVTRRDPHPVLGLRDLGRPASGSGMMAVTDG